VLLAPSRAGTKGFCDATKKARNAHQQEEVSLFRGGKKERGKASKN
jgi:hypothetical protein